MKRNSCDCPESIELFTDAVWLHKLTCEYCVDKGFDALIIDGVVMSVYVEPITVANSMKSVLPSVF